MKTPELRTVHQMTTEGDLKITNHELRKDSCIAYNWQNTMSRIVK